MSALSDSSARQRPRSKSPAAKRSRGQCVFLQPFDDPARPVEVPRSLLSEHRCRLSLLVEKEEPAGEHRGAPMWQAGPALPRAVLVSLVRSLATGELACGRDVTMRELLLAFQFEGISVRELGAVPRVKGVAQLEPPPRGLMSLETKPGGLHAEVDKICDQVALALMLWPRLEMGLTAAAEGRSGQNTRAGSFACSATRCWIAFANPPGEARRGGPVSRGQQMLAAATAPPREEEASIETLARKWPRWLSSLVITLELLHARRLRDPANAHDEFSAQLFKEIQAEYEQDTIGRFCIHRFDVPSGEPNRALNAFRREIHDARIAAYKLRTLAMEPLPESSSDGTVDRRVQWARAAIVFAEQAVAKTPNLAMLFSDQFADENGGSYERAALAKALKKNGLKIVRWKRDDEDLEAPLVFPTHFQTRDRASALSSVPAMLLSVEQRA